jgi:signal transduction histidine kinase
MRRGWGKDARGLAVTVAALVAVEAGTRLLAVDRQVFPGSLLAPAFLAVVYAAFIGGVRGGLLSAGAVALYAFTFFFPAPLLAEAGLLARAIVIGSAVVAAALLVGRLRGALDEAHEAALALERREAARLAEANRELTHANQSLRAFSHVVSHDLKEPARTMEAYLGFLEEDAGPRLDGGSRDLLRQARVANRRLVGLVESLLELSRAVRVDPASLGPVRVEEALADALCASRFEGLRAQRQARVEAQPGIPPVLATKDVLCQILGNLVLNAIKHRPGSGGLVRVGGRALEGGRVEVTVEDDGPGFPEGILGSFASPEAWDNLPSTSHPRGFGLTIAARAVGGLGGSIRLDRSPTLGGARVTLELPAG